jgi:hypothetical protein
VRKGSSDPDSRPKPFALRIASSIVRIELLWAGDALNQVRYNAIRANLKTQSARVRRIVRSGQNICYETGITYDQPHAT